MKYFICDITGRTINYDEALCEALGEVVHQECSVEFWSQGGHRSLYYTYRPFYSVVPSRYKNSRSIFVLFLKALDTIFAFFIVFFRLLKNKPDVFHLQWLPFLSLGNRGANIDFFFLELMRKISARTKFVFTIHNMCPHGMKEDGRMAYNTLFAKAMEYFDCYVVHTHKTKDEVCQTFGLAENKVVVIHHGVFIPKDIVFERKQWDQADVHIIMYGSQNWYKGTDVLVKALQLIPNEYKERIHVRICGVVDGEMQKECSDVAVNVELSWDNYYLTDEQLYKRINESDIIVLPYRRISQSGVLLLALATNRIIITSDLPTFKETLCNYDENLFFESENPSSLADLIVRYINEGIDREEVLEKLSELKGLYSWSSAANKTLQLYNR